MTIYLSYLQRAYVKFMVVVSSARWLVSVAGMVEVEEKQQDDRCGLLCWSSRRGADVLLTVAVPKLCGRIGDGS